MKDTQTNSDTKQILRILLVDDQKIIAEGIRGMLADEQDMELHYCQDPAKAIHKAIEINATLILQDLIMPDIDGMTLVRFYRANNATKDIPVIVLSSKEDPAIKSEAFENGATDYLVKLPDRMELIARIRAHTRQYLMQCERDAALLELQALKQMLQQRNAELRLLTAQDGLTGISNRRCFDKALTKEWGRAQRHRRNLGLIMIDVDHFKFFNDTYGHQQGDKCLQAVASTIDDTVSRNGDLVARYGGEEFVVILPETDLDGAMKVAEQIRAAIENLKIEHSSSLTGKHVTVSLGCVCIQPTHDMDADSLVKQADAALYQAKEKGRNRAEPAADMAA
ncbi:MAG TPA: diguanylate cyclase [Gammaproteobacteria bacterium]|nr:diguanylate cyclase [Gammaproteobacteria bacterium]